MRHLGNATSELQSTVREKFKGRLPNGVRRAGGKGLVRRGPSRAYVGSGVKTTATGLGRDGIWRYLIFFEGCCSSHRRRWHLSATGRQIGEANMTSLGLSRP